MPVDLNISEILKVFDIFLNTLGNVGTSVQLTKDQINKAFSYGQFIEATILRARQEGKLQALDNHFNYHCLKKKYPTSFKASDLESACDKLLEFNLKNSNVSIEVLDEFFKLYTRQCGSNRLDEFLKRMIVTSLNTNQIINGLEEIGISHFNMEKEALIMNWENEIEFGNTTGVDESLNKMCEHNLSSQLVQFLLTLPDDNKVHQAILKVIKSKIMCNDASVCLALLDMDNTSLVNYLKNDTEFFIYFLDAVFYFGRNMKKLNNQWTSNSEFKYEHLVKTMKSLLNNSGGIYDMTNDRLQLVKKQDNTSIWHDIENDCEW